MRWTAPAVPVAGQFDDAEEGGSEEENDNRGSSLALRSNPSDHRTTQAGRMINESKEATNFKVENEVGVGAENFFAGSGDGEEDGYDDYYDYDDDYCFDDEWQGVGGGGSARGGGGAMAAPAQLAAGWTSKHVNLGAVHERQQTPPHFSHAVSNVVDKMRDLEHRKRTLTQGRDDRATSEQVLDPRTRLILFKLLSRGALETIDGCLSTGKEANVYYAKAGQKLRHSTAPNVATVNYDGKPITELAIKVYKTSILVFKDRDRYVSGETRWRNGYCKSNPRKMVQLWAEKELRNYKRIHQAGIPCPTPVLLKSHVLLMEFLGTDGWPAPRLKDANLGEKRLREAYVQCVLILRHLYRRCNLVHGDLSEYNLLWHDQRVYVIDCSQSVLSDHPTALEFLRHDIANVNGYFRKAANLPVLTTRQLFEFVTDDRPILTNDPAAESHRLDELMVEVEELAAMRERLNPDEARHRDAQEQVDDAVFLGSFLPRSLNQVAESDQQRIKDGAVDASYARAVAALTGENKDPPSPATLDAAVAAEPASAALVVAAAAAGDRHVQFEELPRSRSEESDGNASEDESSGLEDDDDDDDDDDSDNDSSGPYSKVPRTPEELAQEKLARRDGRRQNKKAGKEEKSEKRKSKVKKKDKKRAIKKTKAGNRKNKQ